jgi:hypothetical protein
VDEGPNLGLFQHTEIGVLANRALSFALAQDEPTISVGVNYDGVARGRLSGFMRRTTGEEQRASAARDQRQADANRETEKQNSSLGSAK